MRFHHKNEKLCAHAFRMAAGYLAQDKRRQSTWWDAPKKKMKKDNHFFFCCSFNILYLPELAVVQFHKQHKKLKKIFECSVAICHLAVTFITFSDFFFSNFQMKLCNLLWMKYNCTSPHYTKKVSMQANHQSIENYK